MEEENKKNKCTNNSGVNGGAFYGLGFVGALIYYIQHAHTFMDGVWGFLQALVWPAIFAYKILEFLIK
jgi:hypothetical protein